MSQKVSLKEKVSLLFGLPVGGTTYALYLGLMNESGKITARSILDLMTIVLDELEEIEKEKKEDLTL